MTHRRIELTANILIIIVACLLGYTLVRGHLFPTPVETASKRKLSPEIGSKVNLPDHTWSPKSRTLILALQTGCRFCNESAAFYKRIIENVKGKDVKLIAVLPGKIEESRAHLSELGIENIEVRQLPLASLQVSGTPTLILANENGEVADFWIGKLPPDKETEVIKKLDLY